MFKNRINLVRTIVLAREMDQLMPVSQYLAKYRSDADVDIVAAELRSRREACPSKRYAPKAVELRASQTEGGMPTLAGYPILYNQQSDLLWGFFRETIASDAAKESIERDDIRALWNHDTQHVFGRTSAGTLTTRNDARGAYMECTPADNYFNRYKVSQVERGDVSGYSFGFIPTEDEWTEKSNGEYHVTILKMDVMEYSPVTFPAYPQTRIDLRSVVSTLTGEIPPDAGQEERENLSRLRNRQLQLLELGAFGI